MNKEEYKRGDIIIYKGKRYIIETTTANGLPDTFHIIPTYGSKCLNYRRIEKKHINLLIDDEIKELHERAKQKFGSIEAINKNQLHGFFGYAEEKIEELIINKLNKTGKETFSFLDFEKKIRKIKFDWFDKCPSLGGQDIMVAYCYAYDYKEFLIIGDKVYVWKRYKNDLTIKKEEL